MARYSRDSTQLKNEIGISEIGQAARRAVPRQGVVSKSYM